MKEVQFDSEERTTHAHGDGIEGGGECLETAGEG